MPQGEKKPQTPHFDTWCISSVIFNSVPARVKTKPASATLDLLHTAPNQTSQAGALAECLTETL